MFRLLRTFLSNVIPGVIRPLKIIWNEVLGAIFLVFAVAAGRGVWKAWQELDEDPAKFFRLVLSAFFVLVMAGFGVHAFWRARKLGRVRP